MYEHNFLYEVQTNLLKVFFSHHTARGMDIACLESWWQFLEIPRLACEICKVIYYLKSDIETNLRYGNIAKLSFYLSV